ncbi:MAG TPA: hypothetical protein DCE41_30250 [Cytophagales bacterium]|nr:hypothetical protein [Cytophagales bacterium]HAA20399.1 hypothetical protein [Cytophagales bacterium]HAP62126.1 hypothetical protein [Cytophagales bacterium]
MKKGLPVFLLLSGLIGLYVGGGLAFFPAELQAQSNILIGDNPSHYSETRAPGVAILSASFIILFGMYRPTLRKLSLSLVTLFFLSYGGGRLLSLILDGRPADGLFYAMLGELTIGAIGAVLLVRTNSSGKGVKE